MWDKEVGQYSLIKLPSLEYSVIKSAHPGTKGPAKENSYAGQWTGTEYTVFNSISVLHLDKGHGVVVVNDF